MLTFSVPPSDIKQTKYHCLHPQLQPGQLWFFTQDLILKLTSQMLSPFFFWFNNIKKVTPVAYTLDSLDTSNRSIPYSVWWIGRATAQKKILGSCQRYSWSLTIQYLSQRTSRLPHSQTMRQAIASMALLYESLVYVVQWDALSSVVSSRGKSTQHHQRVPKRLHSICLWPLLSDVLFLGLCLILCFW